MHDIETNGDATSVIDMALTLARRLGIGTNAEGVETTAQFAALRTAGCDQVQGYLFSKAIPAAELELLLKAERQLRP